MGMPSRDNSSMSKLQAVQVGVAKEHASGKGPRQERLPIDPVILQTNKTVWSLLATELNTNELGYLLHWTLSGRQNLLTTTNFDPD